MKKKIRKLKSIFSKYKKYNQKTFYYEVEKRSGKGVNLYKIIDIGYICEQSKI